MGRVTPLADGSIPEGAEEREHRLRTMILSRCAGPRRFDREKIAPTQ